MLKMTDIMKWLLTGNFLSVVVLKSANWQMYNKSKRLHSLQPGTWIQQIVLYFQTKQLVRKLFSLLVLHHKALSCWDMKQITKWNTARNIFVEQMALLGIRDISLVEQHKKKMSARHRCVHCPILCCQLSLNPVKKDQVQQAPNFVY